MMAGWNGERWYKGVGEGGGEGEVWAESPIRSCFSIGIAADSGSQNFLPSDIKSHQPIASLAGF